MITDRERRKQRDILQTRLILKKMEEVFGDFDPPLIFYKSLNKQLHINQNCHNHFYTLQCHNVLTIASNAPFIHS